ncbi:MAG: iron ABC transporter substrate-binding protein [Solirubrobacteraceae bacterium]|nr:iron ABC transporter substrate-binding protein [Solirubrobacteraceae bacterium]
MRSLRSSLVVCSLLVSSLGLAACGSDDEDSSTTPSASGGDVELTVYSGRDEELVAPLLDRFEQREGIKLKVRYGDSAELAATIREEGDRSPADVYFGQDAGALGALAKGGALAELPAETLDRVGPGRRSTDGRWVGTSGRVRVMAYDKRELKPSDLPDSVFGLTDPKWKGKVAWAPTNASFQAFVTAMRKIHGEDRTAEWLEAMKDNDTEAYDKNGLIRDAVAAGEVQIGLINHYYVSQKRAEEKDPEAYPVALHFPRGDVGSLINVAGGGVLASSDHQDEARRLIDFLLEREAQEYFRSETAEYPLAAGVEPLDSLPKLADVPQPDLDLSDIDDLEGTLKLLERTGVL